MNIITRNLFRLLRAGVFHRQEQVEPMSAWKWGKALELALLHGVEAETWEGVKLTESQPTMHLTDHLHRQWEQSAHDTHHQAAENRHIANPLLARKLKKMEEEAATTPAYALLHQMVDVALCLLSADRWVRPLLALGQLLESDCGRIDRDQLLAWTAQLRLQRMLQLEGALLVALLGIDEQRLPFDLTTTLPRRERMVEEVAATISATRHQWQFYTEESDAAGNVQHRIFVHNSNASAMFWQARHSARYMKYYPSESMATFFTSLAQSLTNIEE